MLGVRRFTVARTFRIHWRRFVCPTGGSRARRSAIGDEVNNTVGTFDRAVPPIGGPTGTRRCSVCGAVDCPAPEVGGFPVEATDRAVAERVQAGGPGGSATR